MRKERDDVLLRAIEAAGGVTALAAALGVTPGAISQWAKCPPERVAAVAKLSGIPRHDLRPDIFPAEAAE